MKLGQYSTVVVSETQIYNSLFSEAFLKYEVLENAVYIIDKQVYTLYRSKLMDLEKKIILPNGESSKNIENVLMLCAELDKMHLDKQAYIIGIGGGMICDLTGFVASIYKRGVRFGFFPTTLLATVDAAIGGKNGINFNQQKNQLGTIRQPQFIWIDTDFFHTLPLEEIQNGYAEILKYACISDQTLFVTIEQATTQQLFYDKEQLEKIVQACMAIKIDIVTKDPEEKDIRKILNFGHTLGHAVELLENLHHGFAVAIGICFAAWLSVKKGYLTENDHERIRQSCEKLGLPTSFKTTTQSIMNVMKGDKKSIGNGVDFVLLEGIGNAKIEKVKWSELEDNLEEYSKTINLS